MKVLVPNLGSTSLKYQLIDMRDERVLIRGRIERIGSAEAQIKHEHAVRGSLEQSLPMPNHRAAIQFLVDKLFRDVREQEDRPDLVAFKVVHAGPRFCGTFELNDEVIRAMERFVAAAPLHNPIYIEAIRIFQQLLPGIPLVGSFETGFHRTMPEAAYLYGVPYEWVQKYGVRKYGFHGASHRYVAGRVPELLGTDRENLRVISCHLGGSSSVCAIQGGSSVDTTMGFSPQSGLENAARCGDFDVFAFLYLVEEGKLTPQDIRDELVRRGGLLGISELSGDVRDLETAAQQGHAGAQRALGVFIYEVKKTIGAYAAVLGGLDALAFTGGIGENSWRTREQICAGLQFLGLVLDGEKNELAISRDDIISAGNSAVPILVISSNEELVVAREAVRIASQRQMGPRSGAKSPS